MIMDNQMIKSRKGKANGSTQINHLSGHQIVVAVQTDRQPNK